MVKWGNKYSKNIREFNKINVCLKTSEGIGTVKIAG